MYAAALAYLVEQDAAYVIRAPAERKQVRSDLLRLLMDILMDTHIMR